MKRLFFLLLLCASTCFAQMPMGGITGPSGGGSYTIAFDNKGVPTGGSCPNSTTCSWTQTVGSAAHPIIFVWISASNDVVNASISSVVATAGSLSLVGHANYSGTYGYDTWLYSLASSSLSSTTQTITVTFSVATGSNISFMAGSFTLTGVNQSSPFDGSAVTTSAASGTSISQNVTVNATGEWIVDSVFTSTQNTGSGATDGIKPTSPQTLINSVINEYDPQGGASYNGPIGSTGSISDGWSWIPTVNFLALVSVVVKPG